MPTKDDDDDEDVVVVVNPDCRVTTNLFLPCIRGVQSGVLFLVATAAAVRVAAFMVSPTIVIVPTPRPVGRSSSSCSLTKVGQTNLRTESNFASFQ